MNRIIALSLLAGASFAAQAHKSWLLPSATVLTPDQWITVDAAVSNDLFVFNHVPVKLDKLVVTAPDGSRAEPANPHTGKFRSSFDLHLTQKGTYRIAVANEGVFASYELDGKKQRWRGDAAGLAAAIPATATAVEITEGISRNETFVTSGAPTTSTFKTSGKGLEMVPTTHPNDLFSGEKATFQLFLDGKPAADLPVTIVPGGSRYRDTQAEISAKTDDKGQFSVSWPAPGMYWLEAEVEDKKTTVAKAAGRRTSYTATLEVLPQ
ncbi:DUF4198 domain-containing protein [Tahibacter amnicola]|uniref:DUF4198 domain-containing protein n=1 Tax=Tahibacter amnicola TaxID=2976241 RepID=A0ABY6BMM3_9GAMM|nr:DUF4198 domain-containing protein [Tahibacter amnicola]UXI70732.1 DUF4198 domain-containing protein [Tahibacter amnicola]